MMRQAAIARLTSLKGRSAVGPSSWQRCPAKMYESEGYDALLPLTARKRSEITAAQPARTEE
jgi:hypothetical protein